MTPGDAVSALDAYLKRHPGTRYLDAMLCDLCGTMRGKRLPIDAAGPALAGGVMLPGSTYLLSAAGDSADPEGLGFSDGDPDATGIALPATLAPAPWAQQPTAQVLLTLRDADGAAYYFEPRNVLARALAKFAALQLRPVVAFELEFYLVDPLHLGGRRLRPPRGALSRQRPAATQVYNLQRVEDFGDYLHAVVDACAQQGIACGAMSAEYAPGQFEINLRHSDRPLDAADQCALFRRAVQSVARARGLQATFMAKPYFNGAARAGSGLHLHISLLDAAGRNVFAGDGDGAAPQLLRAIGGLQQTLMESMAIFAPNINSFRRFVPDQFVPVNASWGFENRSVAMRVPKCKHPAGADARIEHRVAGADANPYLALAAVLAGIHHGLATGAEAGPPATGNAGEKVDPQLPLEVPSAAEKCRRGRVLPGYFGQRYLDAYCDCKLAEYRDFTAAGQPEAAWYL